MAANDNLYGSKVGTYSSGGVITHTLFNTEFNAIANSFHVTNGHNHDGTAGAGAPITTLYSNAVSIGTNADTDIALTFNANSNDGILTWMEDEDYFVFSDDVLINSTEKLYFADTASFIQQSSDGVLRIDGEATIDLNASTAVTVSHDLKLDNDGAILGFGADNDVTLTHSHNAGLILNSTDKLFFGSTSHSINCTNLVGGGLDIISTGQIHLDSSSLAFGEDSGLDVNITFKGGTNDGTFLWMEDEDYFRFNDDVLINSTEKLQFNDTAVYINSSTDGQLDIVADVLIKTSGGLATTPVTLTGAGGALAVDITESQMFLNTGSGTTTLTMAAGADGQQMRITMEVAGNNATMSTSDGNLVASQASSILWDAVGESVDFVYSESLSKWLIVNVQGATLS